MAERLPMPKPGRIPPIYIFLFFILLGIILYGPAQKTSRNISYSEFKDLVIQKKVTKVYVGKEKITGTLLADPTAGVGAKTFTTLRPPIEDPYLIKDLAANNVSVEGVSETPGIMTSIFINLLPWILIFGFFYYSSKKISSGAGGIKGNALFPGRGKEFEEAISNKKFSDVAGANGAKKDLEEIIEFLKSPEKFNEMGAKLPKGVLMVGPPGTGKTLLAKACAGEAGVPFFSLSGSEFIELYVGMGASRVRNLFKKARDKAPSIIFIDEIDSIGRARGTGLGGGHDEREQTLNQILAEMDGFQSSEAVVVLAATNRPDVLDSALIRPGRFDRQVVLDLPLVKAREDILKIHAKNIHLNPELTLEEIAQGTPGFSGADLENLVNEATLLSIRAGKQLVDREDFDLARDKVIMGNPREEFLTEKDKEVIAIHESGHALVALLTPGTDPVRKITILPRGRALGFTEQVPVEDRVNQNRDYILGQIAVLLGGRLAEMLIFDVPTTGAENDLKRATTLARKMVMNWGMSDKLGLLAFEQGEDHPFLGKELSRPKNFSEKTMELIDAEVHSLIGTQKQYVSNLLKNNRDKLLALSGELLQKETLTDKDVEQLLGTEIA